MMKFWTTAICEYVTKVINMFCLTEFAFHNLLLSDSSCTALNISDVPSQTLVSFSHARAKPQSCALVLIFGLTEGASPLLYQQKSIN